MNKDRRNYYLDQMDIVVWEKNRKHLTLSSSSSVSACKNSWEILRSKAEICQSCVLAKTRTHVVFGVGNQQAEWMIVGEAPGFYEDQQAEPFVGKAGQLLNAMIQSVGKKRSDVYIANVLKCRPPNNRDPLPEEVAQCKPFLTQQIELVSPKFILALGCHAARFLLNTEQSIGQLRGKWYEWGDKKIPVLVSYHPAYLLRNPSDKFKAFADWVSIKKRINILVSGFPSILGQNDAN